MESCGRSQNATWLWAKKGANLFVTNKGPLLKRDYGSCMLCLQPTYNLTEIQQWRETLVHTILKCAREG